MLNIFYVAGFFEKYLAIDIALRSVRLFIIATMLACVGNTPCFADELESRAFEDIWREAVIAVQDYFEISLDDVNIEIADSPSQVQRFVYERVLADAKLTFDSAAVAKRKVHEIARNSIVTIVGLFVPRENTVFFIEDQFISQFGQIYENSDVLEDIRKAILIHELVHAVQEKKYASRKLILDSAHTIDSHRALGALLEGHAQYVTSNICIKIGCINGFNILSNNIGLIEGSHSSHDVNFDFQYKKSEQYVRQFIESFGEDNIGQLFKKHLDPYAIASPEKYAVWHQLYEELSNSVDLMLRKSLDSNVGLITTEKEPVSVQLLPIYLQSLAQLSSSRNLKIDWLDHALYARKMTAYSPGRMLAVLITVFSSEKSANDYLYSVNSNYTFMAEYIGSLSTTISHTESMHEIEGEHGWHGVNSFKLDEPAFLWVDGKIDQYWTNNAYTTNGHVAVEIYATNTAMLSKEYAKYGQDLAYRLDAQIKEKITRINETLEVE